MSLDLVAGADDQLLLFGELIETARSYEIQCALIWLEEQWKMRIAGGLDSFPYTEEFEALYERFCSDFGKVLSALMAATHSASRKNAFWITLLNLRKSGHLATHGRRSDSKEINATARELVVARNHISLPDTRSLRERLPYTEEFNELFGRFHRECRSRLINSVLDTHGFWRLLARIMKADRRTAQPNLFGRS